MHRETHVFDHKDGPPRDLSTEVLVAEDIVLLDSVVAQRLVVIGQDNVAVGRDPLSNRDELSRSKAQGSSQNKSVPGSLQLALTNGKLMVEGKERTFGNFASTARLTSATLTALGCLSGKSTMTEGRVFAPLDARGVRVILTILSESGEGCDERACRSDSRREEAGGRGRSQALMLTSAESYPSLGLASTPPGEPPLALPLLPAPCRQILSL